MTDVFDPVVAAGAVVWRPGDDHTGGGIDICLIYRRRYDDWTLPKGKLEPGEHPLACAAREVEEETGQHVSLGRPLPSLRYQVAGREKVVHYWAARADDAAPPWPGSEEVDAVLFLPAAEAMRRLTHPRDAETVAALVERPVDTTAVAFLRHTKAVARSRWRPPDQLRPLSDRGTRQAAALVAPFAALGLTRVVSSVAVRCADSVRDYADRRGIAVELEDALSEEGFEAAPDRASDLIRKVLADGEATVVCSHRPVLPRLVATAAEQARIPAPAGSLAPGAFHVAHHVGGVILDFETHLP